MRLFKRRDTRTWALAIGGFAAMCTVSFALGTPAWWPAVHVPLGLAAGTGVGAAICWRRRTLPPDIDLAWIGPAEAGRLVAAGPPPGRTLLYVAFERDLGRRYRLDVLVDGARVGQLRPGSALLLPLQPGQRRMEAYLDRRATMVSELINSIPGGYAGFVVRNRGSRGIELVVTRDPAVAPHRDARLRLVRPAVPEA